MSGKQAMMAVVISFALATFSSAQTTTTTTTTTQGGASFTAMSIEPEVLEKVKQYIATTKPKAAAVPADFTVRRGVVLPVTVEAQDFPAHVGVTRYRYVVIGNQTVLVNSNRQIVEVIE